MVSQPKTRLTPEEYLALERQAETKHEYRDGEMVAMSGASRLHNLITVNVAAALHSQLRDRNCETYTSDMRVGIRAHNLYVYPDVVVVCGEPKFEDDEFDTLLNPVLIVEVLSKSTQGYDHVEKFEYYRTLESLADYLLIAQDEQRVEHYAKQAEGRWLLSDIRAGGATVELRSVGCRLEMREIYDKVTFG